MPDDDMGVKREGAARSIAHDMPTAQVLIAKIRARARTKMAYVGARQDGDFEAGWCQVPNRGPDKIGAPYRKLSPLASSSTSRLTASSKKMTTASLLTAAGLSAAPSEEANPGSLVWRRELLPRSVREAILHDDATKQPGSASSRG
jgi:hypothetical protein